MKKLKTYVALMVLLITVIGCHKVEEIELKTNALLPLAVNNTWTYNDTMIVTSDYPSADTLVSETTYLVEKEVYTNLQRKEGDKTIYERIFGFELKEVGTTKQNAGIFPLGDTLYTTVPNNFYSKGICDAPLINGGFVGNRKNFWTNRGYLMPIVAFPANDGNDLGVFPSFHAAGDFGVDAIVIGGEDLQNNKIKIRPLRPQAGLVSKTTDAGTFVCKNYGWQLWAEGIGMVYSQLTDTTLHTTSAGVPFTVIIDWRRSLKRYHLE